MVISTALVKELRERTGLPIIDCRNALVETEGDVEKAVELLRTRSSLKAAKKADRTAAEGVLALKVAADGRVGAMVEVNIETDFAARNDQFIAFVEHVLDAAFENRETDVAKLVSGALGAERERLVQGIGENVSVRRAAVFSFPNALIAGYLHTDKRKGALVALEGGNTALGRDIAMHVTATGPLVVEGSEMPAETLAHEREIFRVQAAESGKPPEIVDKMVEGRVRKYLAEVSLVDQAFVKDPEQRIGQLLKQQKARCVAFVRFQVGEGIAKETKDFAAEVAAQVQSRH